MNRRDFLKLGIATIGLAAIKCGGGGGSRNGKGTNGGNLNTIINTPSIGYAGQEHEVDFSQSSVPEWMDPYVYVGQYRTDKYNSTPSMKLVGKWSELLEQKVGYVVFPTAGPYVVVGRLEGSNTSPEDSKEVDVFKPFPEAVSNIYRPDAKWCQDESVLEHIFLTFENDNLTHDQFYNFIEIVKLQNPDVFSQQYYDLFAALNDKNPTNDELTPIEHPFYNIPIERIMIDVEGSALYFPFMAGSQSSTHAYLSSGTPLTPSRRIDPGEIGIMEVPISYDAMYELQAYRGMLATKGSNAKTANI
jgi:hypothetical protein